MFFVIWVISIILSYFIYRYAFIVMQKDMKETCPVVLVVVIMFLPIINIIWGLLMFSFKDIKMPAEQLIDNIFKITR